MNFWWRKLMASFIVIWALMDMTVPGMCQSDDLEAVPASVQAATPATHNSNEGSLMSSSDTDSSNPMGAEDCFCCCSHVVPTGVFHIAEPLPFVACEAPYAIGSPHEFSAFLYHPPKA